MADKFKKTRIETQQRLQKLGVESQKDSEFDKGSLASNFSTTSIKAMPKDRPFSLRKKSISSRNVLDTVSKRKPNF